MIALILSVCLAHGTACRDVVISPSNSGATFIGCMVAGQVSALRWMAEHPQFVLKAWRCGPPQRSL